MANEYLRKQTRVSYWNFSMSLFLRRPSFQLSPNQSVSAVRVKEKARSGVISYFGGWGCFTRAKIKRSKLLWTVNIPRNLPNKFKGVLSLRMVKSCLFFFIKEKWFIQVSLKMCVYFPFYSCEIISFHSPINCIVCIICTFTFVYIVGKNTYCPLSRLLCFLQVITEITPTSKILSF